MKMLIKGSAESKTLKKKSPPGCREGTCPLTKKKIELTPLGWMKRRYGKKKANYGKETHADGLSPPERVCSLLRDVQWKTNCSTMSLQSILDALGGELGEAIRQCKVSGFELPRSVKSADQKMRDTVCLCELCLGGVINVNQIV